jgi:hypothetical protein
MLVYTIAGAAVELDLSQDAAAYDVQWLDAATGAAHRSRARVNGGAVITLTPPEGGAGRPWVAWLAKRTGR